MLLRRIHFHDFSRVAQRFAHGANYGVAQDAKRRAENFTRAYYKTMHKICEYALASATEQKGLFAKAELDLTAPDGLPLFARSHKWGIGDSSGTQSNYFYGNIFSGSEGGKPSTAVFEEALGELAVKLRNMKDENGEVLGYNADTIILPATVP